MANPVIDTLKVSPASPATIFVNPAAGGGKATSFIEQVRRIFLELGIPCEFVQTSSVAEMKASIRAAIAQGRKLLISMGGDGTLQELVNVALREDVVLGVLPLGGGNDFAAAMDLPKNPIDATRLMLQGEIRSVDLLSARTSSGHERVYLGGSGFGLDSEAMKYANGIFRNWPGRLRYVAAAVKSFFHSSPIGVIVTFPDSNLPEVRTNVLLAAVMNIPTYGAGLCLAPEAKIDDGSFEVVLLQKLSTLEVIRVLPRLLATGELRTQQIFRLSAKSARFMADKPCVFQAEGELLGEVPVEITILPQAVRVLAPTISRKCRHKPKE